jgi:hypothetical protein
MTDEHFWWWSSHKKLPPHIAKKLMYNMKNIPYKLKKIQEKEYLADPDKILADQLLEKQLQSSNINKSQKK